MKLYRYRAANTNTYHEVATGKIWYSSFEELNDPCEGLYVSESSDNGFDDFLATLHVCCFSKRADSLLLWAHYADSHRGVCLEYEVGEDIFKKQFFDVTYSDSVPALEKLRTFPPGHPAEGRWYVHKDVEGAIFKTKSTDWEYEQECRTMRINEDPYSKGQLADCPGKLTGVKFGLRAAPATIHTVHAMLSARKEIIFQRAELLNNKYAVHFTVIDRTRL